jgi:hypothetical protein
MCATPAPDGSKSHLIHIEKPEADCRASYSSCRIRATLCSVTCYFPSKRAVVLSLYDELSAEYAARARGNGHWPVAPQ